MDLFRLRCFVALAEELHFRRAAARMHMTQPGISEHLRQLEDQLAVQLLHRNRRHVSLTRAGEILLEEARVLLAQADRAVQRVRRTDRGELGELVIGVTQPALFIVYPEILRAFRERLPEVGVVTAELSASEQEAALRAGRIHAGIVHPPLDDPSIACTPIARVAFDVVMSDRNPLASKKNLSLADLAGERFVMFPRRVAPHLYDEILALCRDAGFTPEVVAETGPAQSIIAYAAAELGVGFIASSYQQAHRPGVIYRALVGPRPQMTLGVLYHDDDASPAVRTFIEVACRIAPAVAHSPHDAAS